MTHEVQSSGHGRVAARYRKWRHVLVTPESIYGTILVSSMIGIAEDEDTDLDVIVVLVLTIFVFWIAHVFAGTVAHHGKVGDVVIPLADALRTSIKHSSGLLIAAIIPVLVLSLGVFGVLDEWIAYYLALFVGVIVLAVLGWLAFAERGARWPVRLAGAIVTSMLGVMVIVLKIVFH